ncbi:MAG: aminotransferase class V-fold PLP-dependent enzyme [Candidatus Solibacter usitatus]|nr:aminotransferase class V-fold PLP-dependent enzyme [Candidatus Solibacter usitatus]
MPNWSEVRELFPALQRWTFLNTATFGQVSRRSVEAMEEHFRRRDETAASDFLSWFDDADRLRAKLATLIRSSPDDIAFLPNACTALGILLNGIDWRQGDEIVTLENEFPNQIYAPLHQGPALKEVPAEGLLDAVTGRTRLVVLSAVNYTSGFRAPLETLAPELRRRGVLLYVDATQMLGALRFDFSAIQPDMLAVNCYKWMLAPNGVGFMAVHPGLRERLRPLSIGWRSHRDWRNVNNLWHGKPELKSTAEKYEGGMLPSSLLYALEASVDLMLELTPDAIEQRVLQLALQTRALFPGALPYADTPIVAANVDDAPALSARLKQQGILTSARHGMLRVSTHFYNDESDIARLAAAL